MSTLYKTDRPHKQVQPPKWPSYVFFLLAAMLVEATFSIWQSGGHGLKFWAGIIVFVLVLLIATQRGIQKQKSTTAPKR